MEGRCGHPNFYTVGRSLLTFIVTLLHSITRVRTILILVNGRSNVRRIKEIKIKGEVIPTVGTTRASRVCEYRSVL